MFAFFSKKKSTSTVGVQLTPRGICCVVIDHPDSGVPIVQGYRRYPVEKGKLSPKVITSLQSYIADNQLEQANSCIVLDDKDYQLFVIEAPNVPKEEMSEAVKWKVKDLILYPLSEAVVDVFLQPDDGDTHKLIANVLVTQKTLVDERIQMAQSLGLNVVAVDVPELAYRNYFEVSEYSDKKIALISIKKSYGKLTVISGAEVYFSRSFPVDYKGGLLDDIPESDIVLEVQRSLDYYERQLKQSVPSTIIYIGENIASDKVTNETKDNLNQKVIVEENIHLALTDDIDEMTSSVDMIATCGAALRQHMVTAAL